MTLVGLALSALLSQTPAVTTSEDSAAKAAASAERAALAAEKAAAAIQKIADSMAPPAPAAPAAAEAPKENPWVGSVGGGVSFITGNAQTLTLTANLSADKKWENWGLGIRASGAYGLANPSANVTGSTTTVNARRAGATVRGDRSFGSGLVSLFVLGGSEFDHMKNIEFRGFGEFGTGLTFANQKEADLEKLFIRLDIAMRAGGETHVNYFPTTVTGNPYAVIILAPRAALVFRWALNKNMRISEEIELIPYLLAPNAGRLLLNNTTKLSARLTESLSLTAALVLNYDSQPPPATPARLPLDAALTIGVEAAF